MISCIKRDDKYGGYDAVQYMMENKIADVTEIPPVDESSKWELLLLLGNWYEPESFESVLSSIASDTVFFST